jgi:hypothetical protein
MVSEAISPIPTFLLKYQKGEDLTQDQINALKQFGHIDGDGKITPAGLEDIRKLLLEK